MTPDELRAQLDRLGLSQAGAARYLDVDARTLRRWATGDVPIPHAVALLLPKLTPREANIDEKPTPGRSGSGSV